jgi:hypothetical protein
MRLLKKIFVCGLVSGKIFKYATMNLITLFMDNLFLENTDR